MKRLLPLVVAPILLNSCASEPTLGDRLIEQGAYSRELGKQWNEGSEMIADGEKQKKKGREMIEDGEKLIKKGEKTIERGRELKAKTEAMASATAS